MAIYTCKYCNNTFTRDANQKPQFCSKTCWYKWKSRESKNKTEKKCSRCGRVFPATKEYFHQTTTSRSVTRLISACRECANIQHNIDYRNKHPLPIDKLPDHLKKCTKCKTVYPKTGQYFYLSTNKRGTLIHLPHCKSCQVEDRKQTNARHPQSMKTALVRRRARVRNLPNDYTSTDWQNALNYFYGCCAICGRQQGFFHTLAMDHWIPLSSSNCPGTVPSNIVPLCHGIDGCNNSKGNRDALEWLTSKYGKQKAKEKFNNIQTYFASIKK